MSQENVEVVRAVVAAWNSHDLERWIACWDRACEWVPRLRGSVEGAQTYRGHEGLRCYWAEDDAVWDQFTVELRQLRAVRDVVIGIGMGTASGKGSGLPVTTPLAMTFRMRDRKIVRGESYLDVNAALEAVGLSDQDAHAES